MQTYHHHKMYAIQRQQHLRREARTERLVAAARFGAPPAGDRLLALLGEWMIRRGTALQARLQRETAALRPVEYPLFSAEIE